MRASPRPGRLTLCLALLALTSCSPRQEGEGLAVDRAGAGGAAEGAGIKAGDRILAWRRLATPPANPETAEGPVTSCAELAEIEVEQGARGPVQLLVVREEKESWVDLPPGDWKLELRPQPEGAPEARACLALARAARLIEARSSPDEVQAAFREAAAAAREARRPLFEAIVRHRQGSADLVTLSACETGLGEDAGGEGLIGLTRAFQYAGARSVLASLWAVSDRSTALLMRRFYAELRKGVSKDEALRQAQLGLIREGKGKAAHPFYWAAFELTGDWR